MDPNSSNSGENSEVEESMEYIEVDNETAKLIQEVKAKLPNNFTKEDAYQILSQSNFEGPLIERRIEELCGIDAENNYGWQFVKNKNLEKKRKKAEHTKTKKAVGATDLSSLGEKQEHERAEFPGPHPKKKNYQSWQTNPEYKAQYQIDIHGEINPNSSYPRRDSERKPGKNTNYLKVEKKTNYRIVSEPESNRKEREEAPKSYNSSKRVKGKASYKVKEQVKEQTKEPPMDIENIPPEVEARYKATSIQEPPKDFQAQSTRRSKAPPKYQAKRTKYQAVSEVKEVESKREERRHQGEYKNTKSEEVAVEAVSEAPPPPPEPVPPPLKIVQIMDDLLLKVTTKAEERATTAPNPVDINERYSEQNNNSNSNNSNNTWKKKQTYRVAEGTGRSGEVVNKQSYKKKYRVRTTHSIQQEIPGGDFGIGAQGTGAQGTGAQGTGAQGTGAHTMGTHTMGAHAMGVHATGTHATHTITHTQSSLPTTDIGELGVAISTPMHPPKVEKVDFGTQLELDDEPLIMSMPPLRPPPIDKKSVEMPQAMMKDDGEMEMAGQTHMPHQEAHYPTQQEPYKDFSSQPISGQYPMMDNNFMMPLPNFMPPEMWEKYYPNFPNPSSTTGMGVPQEYPPTTSKQGAPAHPQWTQNPQSKPPKEGMNPLYYMTPQHYMLMMMQAQHLYIDPEKVPGGYDQHTGGSHAYPPYRNIPQNLYYPTQNTPGSGDSQYRDHRGGQGGGQVKGGYDQRMGGYQHMQKQMSQFGGSKLGNYEIQNKWDQDVDGPYWTAVNKRTGKKELLRLEGTDPKKMIHLQHTAQQLKKLKSPNLLQLNECLFEDDLAYMFSEYPSGGNLKEDIKKRKDGPSGPDHFKEASVIETMMQVTTSLKLLHDQRLMHGNLSTENIFLGKEGNIKVGDISLHSAAALGMHNRGPSKLDEADGSLYQADIKKLAPIMSEICTLTPYNPSMGDIMHRIPEMYGPQVRQTLTALNSMGTGRRPADINDVLTKLAEASSINRMMTQDFPNTDIYGRNNRSLAEKMREEMRTGLPTATGLGGDMSILDLTVDELLPPGAMPQPTTGKGRPFRSKVGAAPSMLDAIGSERRTGMQIAEPPPLVTTQRTSRDTGHSAVVKGAMSRGIKYALVFIVFVAVVEAGLIIYLTVEKESVEETTVVTDNSDIIAYYNSVLAQMIMAIKDITSKRNKENQISQLTEGDSVMDLTRLNFRIDYLIKLLADRRIQINTMHTEKMNLKATIDDLVYRLSTLRKKYDVNKHDLEEEKHDIKKELNHYVVDRRYFRHKYNVIKLADEQRKLDMKISYNDIIQHQRSFRNKYNIIKLADEQRKLDMKITHNDIIHHQRSFRNKYNVIKLADEQRKLDMKISYNDIIHHQRSFRNKYNIIKLADERMKLNMKISYNDIIHHQRSFRNKYNVIKLADEQRKLDMKISYNDIIYHQRVFRNKYNIIKLADEQRKLDMKISYNDIIHHQRLFRYKYNVIKQADEERKLDMKIIYNDIIQHQRSFRNMYNLIKLADEQRKLDLKISYNDIIQHQRTFRNKFNIIKLADEEKKLYIFKHADIEQHQRFFRNKYNIIKLADEQRKLDMKISYNDIIQHQRTMRNIYNIIKKGDEERKLDLKITHNGIIQHQRSFRNKYNVIKLADEQRKLDMKISYNDIIHHQRSFRNKYNIIKLADERMKLNMKISYNDIIHHQRSFRNKYNVIKLADEQRKLDMKISYNDIIYHQRVFRNKYNIIKLADEQRKLDMKISYNDIIHHQRLFRYKYNVIKQADEERKLDMKIIYNDIIQHQRSFRNMYNLIKLADEQRKLDLKISYNDIIQHQRSFRNQYNIMKLAEEQRKLAMKITHNDIIQHQRSFRNKYNVIKLADEQSKFNMKISYNNIIHHQRSFRNKYYIIKLADEERKFDMKRTHNEIIQHQRIFRNKYNIIKLDDEKRIFDMKSHYILIENHQRYFRNQYNIIKFYDEERKFNLKTSYNKIIQHQRSFRNKYNIIKLADEEAKLNYKIDHNNIIQHQRTLRKKFIAIQSNDEDYKYNLKDKLGIYSRDASRIHLQLYDSKVRSTYLKASKMFNYDKERFHTRAKEFYEDKFHTKKQLDACLLKTGSSRRRFTKQLTDKKSLVYHLKAEKNFNYDYKRAQEQSVEHQTDTYNLKNRLEIYSIDASRLHLQLYDSNVRSTYLKASKMHINYDFQRYQTRAEEFYQDKFHIKAQLDSCLMGKDSVTKRLSTQLEDKRKFVYNLKAGNVLNSLQKEEFRNKYVSIATERNNENSNLKNRLEIYSTDASRLHIQLYDSKVRSTYLKASKMFNYDKERFHTRAKEFYEDKFHTKKQLDACLLKTGSSRRRFTKQLTDKKSLVYHLKAEKNFNYDYKRAQEQSVEHQTDTYNLKNRLEIYSIDASRLHLQLYDSNVRSTYLKASKMHINYDFQRYQTRAEEFYQDKFHIKAQLDSCLMGKDSVTKRLSTQLEDKRKFVYNLKAGNVLNSLQKEEFRNKYVSIATERNNENSNLKNRLEIYSTDASRLHIQLYDSKIRSTHLKASKIFNYDYERYYTLAKKYDDSKLLIKSQLDSCLLNDYSERFRLNTQLTDSRALTYHLKSAQTFNYDHERYQTIATNRHTISGYLKQEVATMQLLEASSTTLIQGLYQRYKDSDISNSLRMNKLLDYNRYSKEEKERFIPLGMKFNSIHPSRINTWRRDDADTAYIRGGGYSDGDSLARGDANPDGDFYAVASTGGIVKIINLKNLEIIKKQEASANDLNFCKYIDNQFVACGDVDGKLHKIDTINSANTSPINLAGRSKWKSLVKLASGKYIGGYIDENNVAQVLLLTSILGDQDTADIEAAVATEPPYDLAEISADEVVVVQGKEEYYKVVVNGALLNAPTTVVTAGLKWYSALTLTAANQYALGGITTAGKPYIVIIDTGTATNTTYTTGVKTGQIDVIRELWTGTLFFGGTFGEICYWEYAVDVSPTCLAVSEDVIDFYVPQYEQAYREHLSY